MKQNFNLFTVLIIGTTLCVPIFGGDNDLDVDIEKIKSKLPEGIEIPDSLKNVTLPSLDDAKKIFKEKCDKVSGSETAFTDVELAANEFKECTSGLIDFEQLQNEIEAAQPNGELDMVFNKYCRKRNIAIDCMQNLTEAIEPCLDPKEIEGQKTFVKIFTNLLNFVCHKDGDQIALFIAEKGPECFKEQKDNLYECLNSTFKKYMPAVNNTPDIQSLPTTLPQLVMGVEQCNDMNALQICFVDHLEKCEESTPANLVESMFKFIRNETPCVNLTSAPSKQSRTSDGTFSVVSSTLFASALTFITVRSLI